MKKQKEIQSGNQQDVLMDKKEITVGSFSVRMTITEDEAKEVINNPKGQVARKLKHYMYSLLIEASKKMLQPVNKELDK